MNYKKIIMTSIAAVAMLMIGTGNVWAVKKQVSVFLFGMSRSLNDSTVYLTEIQVMPTAFIDSKTKFLLQREKYSDQLTEYLQKQGVDYPTTITEYSTSRNKAEKKFLKHRNKYMRHGGFDVKIITTDSFLYTSPEE